MARQYTSDLGGIAARMQDRAPEVSDPTLMALSELIEVIAVDYEAGDGAHDHLVRAAYRVGVAWLLNQEAK